ncbi:MAG: twitching motility protein PilT, partial [Anaerolineales bacterium]
MKVARFDFDPDLQALLKRNLRGQPVVLRFQGPQSVKHLIESLGIPHTEIGPLSANGQKIGLDYITQDGDRIEVRSV